MQTLAEVLRVETSTYKINGLRTMVLCKMNWLLTLIIALASFAELHLKKVKRNRELLQAAADCLRSKNVKSRETSFFADIQAALEYSIVSSKLVKECVMGRDWQNSDPTISTLSTTYKCFFGFWNAA